MNVLKKLMSHSRLLLAVAALLGVGAAAYRASDCCAPGAPCCTPGADCCAGHHHADAER